MVIIIFIYELVVALSKCFHNVSECQNCWTFSYKWGYMSQTIDLEREGFSAELLDQMKPSIYTSVWTSAVCDTSSVFSFTVRLLTKTTTQKHLELHEVVPKSSIEQDILSTTKELDQYENTNDSFTYGRCVRQWNDGEWKKIGHTFTHYPDGIRYIQVTFGGKDTMYCAGNFGGRAAAPCIKIILPDSVKPEKAREAHKSEAPEGESLSQTNYAKGSKARSGPRKCKVAAAYAAGATGTSYDFPELKLETEKKKRTEALDKVAVGKSIEVTEATASGPGTHVIPPFAYNLLTNWDGADKYSGWTHGGFGIEHKTGDWQEEELPAAG